jgi:hypothetical protein
MQRCNNKNYVIGNIFASTDSISMRVEREKESKLEIEN